ncbi:HAMP domain-containing protein [Aquicoccus sp. SCR17]|nr:HAMP domain-containing protein [Carideicomes alvinocaridis]
MTTSDAAANRTKLGTSSVFAKIVGLMGLSTFMVAAALALMDIRQSSEIAMRGLVDLASTASDAYVETISGPLAYDDSERMAGILTAAVDNFNGNALASLAYNAAGDPVASYGTLPPDAQAEIAQSVGEALRSGQPQISEDGLTRVLPVYRGDKMVGAFAHLWTGQLIMREVHGDQAFALGLATVIFLLFTTGTTVLLRRILGQPLEAVAAAIRSAADGEYDQDLHRLSARHDEIGRISGNLSELLTKLRAAREAEKERAHAQQAQAEMVDRLSRGLTTLASGDLTATIDSAFPSEYEAIRSNYNMAILNMQEVISDVRGAAEGILSGAEEINRASDDLNGRTMSQASTLEETAAALEELSSSVRSASNTAQEVSSTVDEARGEAEQSGSVVNSAVSAMTDIERSSVQVQEIIGLIDDIAFQTNLLALNAGVEAARAGDSGKGFAVVASEVRALAKRSSDAAREIKTLIAGSSEQVKEGVGLVGKAGETFKAISGRVNTIAKLVSNIASSAKEQSVGLTEINSGMSDLDKVTQRNAAMVEQSAAATRHLRDEAQRLRDLVSRFQIAKPASREARSEAA